MYSGNADFQAPIFGSREVQYPTYSSHTKFVLVYFSYIKWAK